MALSSHKVLVEHYVVAACIIFQACPVWLVSVYLPPKSPKTFVCKVFKALLTLETHPVFIAGDFNRCDQHHPQLWEDFLGQLGATDVDPSFPTFRFGEQQESPLDRFLVPSFFLDATQLHVRLAGRYRVSTCHHKTVTAFLTMKPRLTPHPQSEKHCTIPTKVFLDPTAFAVGEIEVKRQQALRLLRRSISLARESCAVVVPLSIHIRSLVWSWWRNSSKAFKHWTVGTVGNFLHYTVGHGLCYCGVAANVRVLVRIAVDKPMLSRASREILALATTREAAQNLRNYFEIAWKTANAETAVKVAGATAKHCIVIHGESTFLSGEGRNLDYDQECFTRANVAYSRATNLTILACPLNMQGMPGALQVLAALLHGVQSIDTYDDKEPVIRGSLDLTPIQVEKATAVFHQALMPHQVWSGPLPVCLAEHHQGKVRRLCLVLAALSHLTKAWLSVAGT